MNFYTNNSIGAVSPAVVVPCLFRLRSKGYGVAKGIPTMVNYIFVNFTFTLTSYVTESHRLLR